MVDTSDQPFATMRRRVDKLLAKMALEALSEAWKHYQAWSLRIEEQGAERPAELLDQYVRLRRLRDYLDNLVAQPGAVVIELDEADANLFTSCMIFAAERVEGQLSAPELEPDYERWYQEKLRNLCDLAQAFACDDVKLLGGRPGTGPLPSHCQAVVTAIHSRLESQKSAQATSQVSPAARHEGSAGTPPPSGIIKGDTYATDFAQSNWQGHRNPLPGVEPAGRPRREPESEFEASYLKPVKETGTAKGYGRRSGLALSDDTSNWGNDTPGAATSHELTASRRSLPDASTPSVTSGSSLIKLDQGLIRDPRLRALLSLDLPAMDRAYGVRDFRTAAVHLGSVFEALVLDVAIQRRSAIKLAGTPDTWRMQALVPKLLESKFSGPDRTALHGLIQSKHLIRPAVQLSNPMPVTQQALDKMLDFVRRFVRECGLSGT